MEITTESEATNAYIFVEAYVPAYFDIDNSDHFEALEDALGPFGGYSSSVESWRENATTYLLRFERDL